MSELTIEELREAYAQKLKADADSIDNDDYITVQSQLLLFAGIVRQLPLRAFLARIDRAEAIGFLFVRPADYQRALPNLDTLKRMAEGLRAFQRSLPNLPPCPHPAGEWYAHPNDPKVFCRVCHGEVPATTVDTKVSIDREAKVLDALGGIERAEPEK